MSKTKKKEAQAPRPVRRLIAQHEFVLQESHIEHPTGASMTVPDESMSIRDILRKHVSGVRIADTMQREGVYYDGDFDSPDVEKLRDEDLTVRDDFGRSVRDLAVKATESAVKAKKDAEQPKTVPKIESPEPKDEPRKEGS